VHDLGGRHYRALFSGQICERSLELGVAVVLAGVGGGQELFGGGEFLNRVESIRAAVPGEERAGSVGADDVKLFSQDFAADGEALLRVA
jgi:hypothetical protein